MRFWDTSAIAPLVVHEAESARADQLIGADPAMVVWWGAPIECGSALARRHREESLDSAGLQAATGRMRKLSAAFIEVPASDELRNHALRTVRVHPLRAADAMHLAAALIASDFSPGALEFVTFDERQARAAELEGFRVIA